MDRLAFAALSLAVVAAEGVEVAAVVLSSQPNHRFFAAALWAAAEVVEAEVEGAAVEIATA